MRLYHFLFCFLFYYTTLAQSFKVGVIDKRAILENSIAYKALQNEWEMLNDSIQIVLQKEQTTLSNAFFHRGNYDDYWINDIDTDTLNLYVEIFRKAGESIQQLQTEVHQQLLDSIQYTFERIATQAATEQHYDLVLNKSIVLSNKEQLQAKTLSTTIANRLDRYYSKEYWDKIATPLFEKNKIFLSKNFNKPLPTQMKINRPFPLLVLILLRPFHY